MLRTQLYISEELHQELILLARQEDVSLAKLTREFLEVGVKMKKRKESSGKTLLALARQSIGGLPKDVSNKHNQYLYGK